MIDGPPSLAGAGFINARISPAWLAARIQAMLQQVTGADPAAARCIQLWCLCALLALLRSAVARNGCPPSWMGLLVRRHLAYTGTWFLPGGWCGQRGGGL